MLKDWTDSTQDHREFDNYLKYTDGMLRRMGAEARAEYEEKADRDLEAWLVRLEEAEAEAGL